MTKFIDGSFEQDELKQFTKQLPCGNAIAYIFSRNNFVDSTLKEFNLDSRVLLEELVATPLSKESANVKAPFDLIVIGDSFFITVKNTKLEANTGQNEALVELKKIASQLSNFYSFNK